MLRKLGKISLLAGFALFFSWAAAAQEVIHALSGTVTAMDAVTKTITIATDDGSEGLFNDLPDPKMSLEFDSNLRRNSTIISKFNKTGERVILYYFGYSGVRTVVALQSLGVGPFTLTTGTVVDFNSESRTIAIKDASGQVKSFLISSDLVAETSVGATARAKYQPDKGNRVQIVSEMMNGAESALFINTLATN
jgi:Cu/Ag efflux protein CusF